MLRASIFQYIRTSFKQRHTIKRLSPEEEERRLDERYLIGARGCVVSGTDYPLHIETRGAIQPVIIKASKGDISHGPLRRSRVYTGATQVIGCKGPNFGECFQTITR